MGALLGTSTEDPAREDRMMAKAESQLQEEYRALVEQIPLGVVRASSQGMLLDANTTALSMLDLPSLEAAKKIDFLHSPSFVDSGIATEFERCLRSSQVQTSEHAYVSGRGLHANLRLCFVAVRNVEGKVLSVQILVESIGKQTPSELVLPPSQERFEEMTSELTKLSLAIEQSANIVIITDAEGNIEYVNPKFTEATGYSATEVLGRNPRILKSGVQNNDFYQELWDTILSGRQWQGEFHNKRKDGTLYWEQASIAPVLNAAGQITNFIGIKLDITERKEAEEAIQRSTERLRTLHEIDQSVLAAQLPETIAVAAIHRIRRLIPCQRVTVIALDEEEQIRLLASASDTDLAPSTDLSLYKELLQARPLGSGMVQGCQDLAALPHPSRLQRMLVHAGIRSYVIVPLFMQKELLGTLNLEATRPMAFEQDHVNIAVEVAASLAVAIRQARLYERANQEIAERMQAEQALRQHTDELEVRNAELDAFAHTVAHDLKHPVTAILGYADLLTRHHDTLAPEILSEFLNIIVSNSRKMASIIDELLLLANVRSMKEIEMEPLDMAGIVAEAKGRLVSLIEERKGSFTMPQSWPVALGYPPWIEAVWTNYISNALKYGGDPPLVILGATVLEAGWIQYWVRDNGSGLSAEERARLFTPFERLHQVRIEGRGLGLSIVQRIIKKLGGQVGVESDGLPGHGSSFYFVLPALPDDRNET
jgi:PAS domain S-box-containing protein